MLYKFLKVLVGFSLKIFFHRIYVSGTEHVNPNKAQLIASNHPSGFLEPLIMACYLPKPLYFLVRGDVFENPIANYFLRATHQIPIFRFRDGFSKMRNNSKTMDESLQVLADKKNLLIFAEGGTQSVKKLRPLQKGIARIAFQTLEAHPDLELEILPTGINFTHFTESDKAIYLKIGAPIIVKPFYKIYCEDKNKGVESLLNALFEAMKLNIIHLENQNLLPIFERTIPTLRAETALPYFPKLVQSDSKLQIEKSWANQLDHLNEDSIQELKNALSLLQKAHKDVNIKTTDLDKAPISIGRLLVLAAGLIPALIGIIYHVLPIGVGLYFKNKVVKQKEFKNSIQFAFGVFLGLIQYVIFFIIAVTSYKFLYFLVLPILSGLWARYYYHIWNNTQWTKKEIFYKFKNDMSQLVHSVHQIKK